MSKIIEINDINFKEVVLDSDKPVLIDFYATWCGPCKMLSPIIEKVAEENNDVVFAKLDVDEAIIAAKKYEIRGVPTLILFRGGKVEKVQSGLMSKGKLLEFIG